MKADAVASRRPGAAWRCWSSRRFGRRAQPVRHAMRGMVLTVDAARKTVVISHERVSGRDAGDDDAVRGADAKELAGLVPGTIVSFTLVLTKESALHRARAKSIRYQSVEQDPMAARRLRLLQNMTGAAAHAAGGRPGRARLHADRTRPRSACRCRSSRERSSALNFIYTSCVLPQFCYRVANHFSVVRDRFKDRMGRDLVLLTVTFDPARDTPERLAQYASQWKADPNSWHFMTGSADGRRARVRDVRRGLLRGRRADEPLRRAPPSSIGAARWSPTSRATSTPPRSSAISSPPSCIDDLTLPVPAPYTSAAYDTDPTRCPARHHPCALRSPGCAGVHRRSSSR